MKTLTGLVAFLIFCFNGSTAKNVNPLVESQVKTIVFNHFNNPQRLRNIYSIQLIDKELTAIKSSPQSNGENGAVKIWAVVVGAAQYTFMPTLRYTDDDAYLFYAFLKSPQGGALEDDQIQLLVDEDATRLNITEAINRVFQKADENDVILFYFSGHGVQGAFLPIDFDGISNKLSHVELKQLINKSPAKHKLIVADACHSGGLFSSFGNEPTKIDLTSYYSAFENTNGGTALFMSSKAEEFSWEDQGLRSGIFSHFLIQGLKGGADYDKSKIVTISELFQYVSSKVKSETDNAQSPIIRGAFDQRMPVAFVRH